MAGQSNGSNAKAFGGVVAIVALIAGVYAMIEPMNQRIDTLEHAIDQEAARTAAWRQSHDDKYPPQSLVDDVEENKAECKLLHQMFLERIKENTAESTRTTAEITAINEKLREVETQFAWSSDIMKLYRHDEMQLFGLLWEQVFGQPLPDSEYWPLNNER